MIVPPEILSCWKPTQRPIPEKWMRDNIYLTSKHSALPGPYNTTQFPYVVGPIQAMREDGIKNIVLRWATQLGKTTLFGAVLCYLSANDPANVLIAAPDHDMALKHWKTKLRPMVDTCDVVKEKMPADRDLNMLMPDLGDHFWIYAWSGSESTLSAMSVRYLFITEINLWSTSASKEGSRVDMARDRIKDAPNAMTFIEGKPHVKGDCPISDAFDEGDQRTYHIPCLHCGNYQSLVPGTRQSVGGLKWEEEDPLNTAYYQCAHCEGKITDQDKFLANRAGIWLKEGERVLGKGQIAPSDWGKTGLKGEGEQFRKVKVQKEWVWIGGTPRKTDTASFHLSSLYSRVITFGEFALRWSKAWKGSQKDRQAFWNGWVGLPWEHRGKKLTREELKTHARNPRGVVTDRKAVLVMTVDVQDNCLYYRTRAWGEFGNSYGIDYGRLDQDMEGESYIMGTDFKKLETLLSQTYEGPEKAEYRIRLVGIDTRYRRQEALEFCAKFHTTGDQRIWPVFGEHQYRQAAMVQESNIRGYKIKALGVDAGLTSDELYERVIPILWGDHGYWSLEEDISEEYLDHMLSHYKTEEIKPDGTKKWIWVPDANVEESVADHWRDCERMQLAIRDKFGLGFVKVQDQLTKKRRIKRRKMTFSSRVPGAW